MHQAFTTEQGIILIRLILLHLINDFLIQPNAWVMHRNDNHHKSSRLYMHGAAAGLMAYIAVWRWKALPIFLVVTVTHTLIDLWKSYQTDPQKSFTFFIIDQMAHILVLLLCWLFWLSGFGIFSNMLGHLYSSYNIMLLALGYVICIFPLGYVVSFGTEQWRSQVKNEAEESLSQAGKWIGMIERILVFTLVIIGQYQTIGFVIAAKSILRFSDAQARKHSEYVLIGTLISFVLAILTGIIINLLRTHL